MECIVQPIFCIHVRFNVIQHMTLGFLDVDVILGTVLISVKCWFNFTQFNVKLKLQSDSCFNLLEDDRMEIRVTIFLFVEFCSTFHLDSTQS